MDGSNYALWAFVLKNILIAKDLWDIVSGEEKRPENPTIITPSRGIASSSSTSTVSSTSSEAQKKFDKRNAQALSLISLSIKRNLLTSIRYATSAKQAWDTLESMYDVKNEARILALRNELSRLKMNDNDNLLDHLNKLKSIVNQLETMGDTIKDSQIVSIALNSLSSNYANFVMSLTISMRVAPISLA